MFMRSVCGRLIFLPLLVLTRRGAALVKISTGNRCPRRHQIFPEIIISTGAKCGAISDFQFCTGNFQAPNVGVCQ